VSIWRTPLRASELPGDPGERGWWRTLSAALAWGHYYRGRGYTGGHDHRKSDAFLSVRRCFDQTAPHRALVMALLTQLWEYRAVNLAANPGGLQPMGKPRTSQIKPLKSVAGCSTKITPNDRNPLHTTRGWTLPPPNSNRLFLNLPFSFLKNRFEDDLPSQ
jgi:hypothetical protein